MLARRSAPSGNARCTPAAVRQLGTRRIALGQRLVARRLGAAQARLHLGVAALQLGGLHGHVARAAAVQVRQHVHFAEYLRGHVGGTCVCDRIAQ